MENIKKSALIETNTRHRPAALEKIPESRSARFGQILSNVITQKTDEPAQVNSAMLGSAPPPRSTFFMDNMSPEQRKSAVEDKKFSPRPAAMESIRRAAK
ncbi:hypothetical protein ALQ33_02712 [Pseudomonas syringae pv. philadelphi]|uniref:Uncharacterized protein n=1 Tax=Pseudomonas syringae pv. philadelphi TaxID=251706 RepID=A0A3M3ZBF6_9PSED|nr:hypothetical protein [Pseudomonas syringae group genomosp. 3]RMO91977.1 hypothetical protein ALQ33_02712 [Pseudomonas syringae pv. philadelphi]